MSIPVIVLAGLNGKTTIGPVLANNFNFIYVESEPFHSDVTNRMLGEGTWK
jgi:gluconate kinase